MREGVNMLSRTGEGKTSTAVREPERATAVLVSRYKDRYYSARLLGIHDFPDINFTFIHCIGPWSSAQLRSEAKIVLGDSKQKRARCKVIRAEESILGGMAKALFHLRPNREEKLDSVGAWAVFVGVSTVCVSLRSLSASLHISWAPLVTRELELTSRATSARSERRRGRISCSWLRCRRTHHGYQTP